MKAQKNRFEFIKAVLYESIANFVKCKKNTFFLGLHLYLGSAKFRD
jgi:hypothetical protein